MTMFRESRLIELHSEPWHHTLNVEQRSRSLLCPWFGWLQQQSQKRKIAFSRHQVCYSAQLISKVNSWLRSQLRGCIRYLRLTTVVQTRGKHLMITSDTVAGLVTMRQWMKAGIRCTAKHVYFGVLRLFTEIQIKRVLYCAVKTSKPVLFWAATNGWGDFFQYFLALWARSVSTNAQQPPRGCVAE